MANHLRGNPGIGVRGIFRNRVRNCGVGHGFKRKRIIVQFKEFSHSVYFKWEEGSPKQVKSRNWLGFGGNAPRTPLKSIPFYHRQYKEWMDTVNSDCFNQQPLNKKDIKYCNSNDYQCHHLKRNLFFILGDSHQYRGSLLCP